jgi:hypothetical protein
MAKTPLRRTGGKAAPKLSEQEARDLAAAIRAKHPTLDEAEKSAEWQRARGQITRMILDLPAWRNSNSPIHSPERAAGIATLYLRAPHLLPPMPPPGMVASAVDD